MSGSCWGLASSPSASVTSLCLLLLCVLGTLCRGQTCHSTGPDENARCSSSRRCRDEHGEDEDYECSGPYPIHQPLEDTKHCYVACPSYSESDTFDILNNSIQANTVSATFYSISWMTFAVNISWDHPNNPSEGYRLIIRDVYSFFYFGCFCIYDRNLSSFNSSGAFYKYIPNQGSIVIELSMIHNLPNAGTTPITKSCDWPSNCLDIIHTDATCALPVYHRPTDVLAYHKFTESGNQTIYLQWSYETPFPLPSVYYIELYEMHEANAVHYFTVYNTSSVANTAILTHLNDSVKYIVTIRPYVRCSGLANQTHYLGCGIFSDVLPVPYPTTSPTLPLETSTQVTTLISTTPLPTVVIKAAPLQLWLNWKRITGISVGFATLIALAVLSLAGISYRACKRNKRLPPLPTSQDHTSVFVVYAPKTTSEKDIQTYIVCRLEEYFDVVTSGDQMRGDTMKWIEEQERTADAVLLVCTEEFHLEWEEKEVKSLVVTAIQTLLSSAVVQERLDKYAIIVLDDKSRQSCIPDNHYLSNMGVYVIGKRKNQLVLDELRRFVTKQAMFEHRIECDDRDRSPSSVVSSTGSSDVRSQCTESVSIDMTLSSSVGSEGSGTSHGLDLLGGDRDRGVACVHCESNNLQSESSLNSEQVHHLLTFLQKPDAESDAASLDSHSESL